MGKTIDQVCFELETTADEVEGAFGNLSAVQLNWKPSQKSWSIAQCLEHLIVLHSLYFPIFERLENGSAKASFWEKASPLSGFFGRFLIRSLRPENQTKVKTRPKAFPSASEIDGGIVERFVKHQHEMIDRLKGLPTRVDPSKTIITSPLMGFVTYSLEDTFTILVIHCQRHFLQAKNVMHVTGFPK
jgi:hypothetical protein